MKRLSTVMTAIICMLLSYNLHAQSKTGVDYFEGKWNVLLKGLPQGDTKMVFILEKKDSTIAGAVQDTTGKEIAKLSKTELKDNEITLYFTAQGYDVSLVMTKKDEDHTIGSLLNMFDAEGDRVKTTK